MRLFQLLVSKVSDFLDPLLSLLGKGSHAEQLLLVNLAHNVLQASEASLQEAIREFIQHLDSARLNKLVFETNKEASPLLLQLIQAAQKKPKLWSLLQDLAQRKFRLPLDWNVLEDKEQEESPSILGRLVSLAFEDEQNSVETHRGAQELLLILINSNLFLDWNARVEEEEEDTAIWALTIAANNGQPWAVAMLTVVIKKYSQTIDWDVNFSDNPNEKDTALSLVTDLALKGSPQYLEGIFSNEVLFSKLNLNARVAQISLVDALLEKPHCAHLARWILLAGKDIDERLLGVKAKGLLSNLRFKLKEIGRNFWHFEQAFMPVERVAKPDSFSLDEAKQRVSSSVLPHIAKAELTQELMLIPKPCQEWIIHAAISQGKLKWEASDVDISTQQRKKIELDAAYKERSHHNTAVLATKALYLNQPVQDVITMLGKTQTEAPKQLLHASKQQCRDTIRAAIDALIARSTLPPFLDAPLRQRIVQAVAVIPFKEFKKASVEKAIQTEMRQHHIAEIACARVIHSQPIVFSMHKANVKLQEREEGYYKEIRSAIRDLTQTNALPSVLEEAQGEQIIEALSTLSPQRCTKAAVESKIRGLRLS